MREGNGLPDCLHLHRDPAVDSISRCPDCRAPNPKGRTTCWSCQAALAFPSTTVPAVPAPPMSVPDANPWGMEAYRRKCSGCGHIHGVFNRACPKCGNPCEAAAPVHSGVLSTDWEQTSTASGETRLRLTSRARWKIGGGALAILSIPLVLVAFSLLNELFGWTYRNRPFDFVMALFFPVIFWLLNKDLVPSALYHCLGREEWYVGSDSLEVRRSLFGRESRTVYAAASLSLTAHWIRTGRSRHRVALLQVRLKNKYHNLCARRGGKGIMELEAVGGALAQLTGWSFQIDADAMDLKRPWI